ncbi:unnamed protein product [Closterium sp. Yama58-4]|nr:unnamed protein product [Closterium sp. Yama58-4]
MLPPLPSPLPRLSAVMVSAELQAQRPLVERAVVTREVRVMARAVRAMLALRRRLTGGVVRAFVRANVHSEADAHSTLLALLAQVDTDEDMEGGADAPSPAPPASAEGASTSGAGAGAGAGVVRATWLAEVEMFSFLTALVLLIDRKAFPSCAPRPARAALLLPACCLPSLLTPPCHSHAALMLLSCCSHAALMLLSCCSHAALMLLSCCSHAALMLLHAALMLLSCCSHAALMLLSCCSHAALMLLSCCSHAALMLLSCCSHAALMLLSCCSHAALMLLSCCSHAALMLLSCCSHAALMLLSCCSHAALMLLPCCSHAAPMLLSCCSHAALMLLSCCSHAALMLLSCCSHAALMLLSCCSHAALMLLSCCSHAALMLLSCCSHAAPMLLSCCSHAALMLLSCCSHAALMLLSCCSHAALMLLSCCSHAALMLLSCCSHAALMLLSCCSHAALMLLSCCSHAALMLLSCCSHAALMLLSCCSALLCSALLCSALLCSALLPQSRHQRCPSPVHAPMSAAPSPCWMSAAHRTCLCYTRALACECAWAAVRRLQQLNRRTLDVLGARIYFYFSLAHERTNALASIRSTLLAAFQTATLRHDEIGQEMLLNLLLRNYLAYNLYDQADKLRSKALRPDSHSNQQLCRQLYYAGRIAAVQLEYSAAKDCLQQATRKAPAAALGFRVECTRWHVVVRLLLGEIPERHLFVVPRMRSALLPFFQLTNAVRVGDLQLFHAAATQHAAVFAAGHMQKLIVRLRHNVIRTALRRISLAYSRISLADIALKLHLPPPTAVADAECIVAKAIRDGGIEAVIERRQGCMVSKEGGDVYTTLDPQAAFHTRIAYCLNLHNEAVKAMQFPPSTRKGEADAEEKRRERQLAEQELAQHIAEEGDDDF